MRSRSVSADDSGRNARDTAAAVSEYAADGRFELYKTSLKYDNPEARRAHEFPLDTQQAEVKELLGETENTGKPYPTMSK